jgi:hypothetical protein
MDPQTAPTNPQSVLNPGCSECRGRLEGIQIYSARRVADQSLMAWDVELALKICSDGRQPVQVHPVQVNEMLRVNQFDPVHLDHVDPALPGIVCAIDYTEYSYPIVCLIDGSHRATRCRRDGLPFFAYVLTDQESQLCQNTIKVKLFRTVQELQEHRDKELENAETIFDPKCPECWQKRQGPEIFTFERSDGGVFAWDITLARQICSDGRPTLPVPPAALDVILSVNQTEPRHLDHVDPRIPGIACACSAGGNQTLLILIDGSHRAALCRRDHLPFSVHMLTAEESLRCQEQMRLLLAQFVSPFLDAKRL